MSRSIPGVFAAVLSGSLLCACAADPAAVAALAADQDISWDTAGIEGERVGTRDASATDSVCGGSDGPSSAPSRVEPPRDGERRQSQPRMSVSRPLGEGMSLPNS